MHPTVEEQLAAIRRLVEAAAADPSMAEGPSALLIDASRQLRRLAGSWAGRFGFLQRDNREAVALLASLRDQLGTWVAEADRLEDAVRSATSENQAHDVNKSLRALLARAARELPDTEAGNAGRRALSAYLRDRVAADPALNRNPMQPAPSTTASRYRT